MIRIAVIGAGAASPREAALAREVGRGIARSGAALVCGGLGGVMEAACRGAHEEGGLTVGILPGIDPASANPWVALPIPTGLGEARNVIVALSGSAVIAVGGEFGTLSEIAIALKHRIPVVALGSWSLAERPEAARGIRSAGSAAEAVALALDLARQD